MLETSRPHLKSHPTESQQQKWNGSAKDQTWRSKEHNRGHTSKPIQPKSLNFHQRCQNGNETRALQQTRVRKPDISM